MSTEQPSAPTTEHASVARFRTELTARGGAGRIVVLTTEGTTLRGTRTYRTCTKKRKSKRPPRL